MAEAHPLDPAFVEKQRQALLELRVTLVRSAKEDEADEAQIKEAGAGEPQEFEDDAQRLATLELDGNLVVRNAERLERIDRALKKIDEGTYGASDQSGQLIPLERLEAAPESIYTLAEEQAREQAR